MCRQGVKGAQHAQPCLPRSFFFTAGKIAPARVIVLLLLALGSRAGSRVYATLTAGKHIFPRSCATQGSQPGRCLVGDQPS